MRSLVQQYEAGESRQAQQALRVARRMQVALAALAVAILTGAGSAVFDQKGRLVCDAD